MIKIIIAFVLLMNSSLFAHNGIFINAGAGLGFVAAQEYYDFAATSKYPNQKASIAFSEMLLGADASIGILLTKSIGPEFGISYLYFSRQMPNVSYYLGIKHNLKMERDSYWGFKIGFSQIYDTRPRFEYNKNMGGYIGIMSGISLSRHFYLNAGINYIFGTIHYFKSPVYIPSPEPFYSSLSSIDNTQTNFNYSFGNITIMVSYEMNFKKKTN